MKQKLFVSLLTIVACLPLLGQTGNIFTVTTIEDVEIKYQVLSEEEKTVRILRSPYPDIWPENVTIPQEVNGYSVREIGPGAFDFLFFLKNVSLPKGIITIGSNAFAATGITSITIPESVTDIGSEAFASSSLKSIVIPKNVKHIDVGVFTACDDLISIVVDTENQTFDSRNYCNAIIRTQDNTLIAGCGTSTIPYGTAAIADKAFNCCHSLNLVLHRNGVIPASCRASRRSLK